MNTFLQSTQGCPFCRQNNLLKEKVIASTERGYLIPAYLSPGCYLIVPGAHTEQLSALPDTWWRDMKELLAHIPGLPQSYNISLNFGEQAGQTIAHLHFWVVPREAGHPSSGKGLARLISEANRE